MRGKNDCFWSSSLFPRLLIDEHVAPHLCRIRSTARRYAQCCKRHAMRDSTDGCTTLTVRDAQPYRQESLFSFQECIATPVGSLRRSLNAAKQCRKRRTNAARVASRKGVANGCFILEKRAVAHCGRSAHRPCQTACCSPFDSFRRPEKRRIEIRGARCSGACTADIGKACGCAHQPPRNAIDSSVKIPTGSGIDRQRERAAKTAIEMQADMAFTPPAYRKK